MEAKAIIFLFLSLFLILFVEVFYIAYTKTLSEKDLVDKKRFVLLSALPDLAISTEATYIRHRTLSNVFDIYKDDPILREYMLSTYSISYSHIK